VNSRGVAATDVYHHHTARWISIRVCIYIVAAIKVQTMIPVTLLFLLAEVGVQERHTTDMMESVNRFFWYIHEQDMSRHC
jgi:hypothetical protein